jgi:hypothetical protein
MEAFIKSNMIIKVIYYFKIVISEKSYLFAIEITAYDQEY